METPILKNVKFGQKFRTVNNNIAIILNDYYEGGWHFDAHISDGKAVEYDINGNVDTRFYDHDYNLVERYVEEIDEAELEKKAKTIAERLIFEPTGWIPELGRPELSLADLIDAVKEGYYLRNNEW